MYNAVDSEPLTHSAGATNGNRRTSRFDPSIAIRPTIAARQTIFVAQTARLVLRAVGRDLHSLVAQACGNPMLAAIIEDFRKRTQLLTIRRVPERVIKVCEEHLAIIDALLAGDGDEARAAMQHHIESVRAYTLEKLGAL